MKKFETKLGLKTLCELDFEAMEKMCMVANDESKIGCVTTQKIKDRIFPQGSKIKVFINEVDFTQCVYANDVTGTIIRYDRDENGKVVFDNDNKELKIVVWKGDVKIEIEK